MMIMILLLLLFYTRSAHGPPPESESGPLSGPEDMKHEPFEYTLRYICLSLSLYLSISLSL